MRPTRIQRFDTERGTLNPPASRLGSINAVMGSAGHARHHVGEFAGSLSIKFMVSGAGTWRSSDGVHLVDQEHFLVLNDGETYTLTIEADEPRESFCPFFRHGFVEDVEQVLTQPTDRLLEQPESPAGGGGFHQHLHPPEGRVVPALMRLRRVVHQPAPDGAAVEAGFTALAEALLLHARAELPSQVARVPAARVATRRECYRRVARARDFMHANAARPLPLAEIARQAPLSPYHFHRLFKAVHGVPPLQYLQRLRLARARRLLRASRLPVTRIALAVGFESPAAFTARFTRAVGMSPSRYRRTAAAA